MTKGNCARCGKEIIHKFPSWTRKFCSNVCANQTIADGRVGTKMPKEVCEKISRSRKGQKPSSQCILASIIANRGKPKTLKWRAAMKKLSGPNNKRWIGGRVRQGNGYIWVTEKSHPFASKYSGYVLEHRLVMEKHIGRYLLKEEQVHHINHIKDDNRIENLKLFSSNSEHIKDHFREGHLHPWKK